MKKTILTTLILCICFIASAQDHLKFKGIPLNGTHKEFSEKLIAKGFTKDVSNNTYTGTFAGYPNCTAEIYATTKNLVYGVALALPPQLNWTALEETYFDFKKNLTTKYGEPTKSTEKFESSTPKKNSEKFEQTKKGNCQYVSHFETPNGEIILYIKHTSSLFLTQCYVILQYCDKTNYELFEKESLEDL